MEMANVGSKDRMVRIVLGLILFVLPITGLVGFTAGWLGTIMMIAGAVFVVTGVFRFCPLYRILGMNTCSMN